MDHQVLHETEYPKQDIRGYGKYLMQIVDNTVKAKGIDARNKHLVLSKIIDPIVVYRQIGLAIAKILQKICAVYITQPCRQRRNQKYINDICANMPKQGAHSFFE